MCTFFPKSPVPHSFYPLATRRAPAAYIYSASACSQSLAMSAGMINTEGVNVDLYIPRKCAAVPVGPLLSPRTVPLPNRPPPALRFLLRLLLREACYVANR